MTSDMDGLITERWKLDLYMDGLPPESVSFYTNERPFKEPPAAYEARIDNWTRTVHATKQVNELNNPGKRYEIRTSDDTGREELLQVEPKERKILYDGKTINASCYGIERNILRVGVYPIDFSEIMACTDNCFSEAYLREAGELPHAGIGVSMIMETIDGYIPMTLRDIETPIYPWFLFTQGGGPKPGEMASEAILHEVSEETGLVQDLDFDPCSMRWMAVVSDSHWMGSGHSRPVIVATLGIHRTYRDMAEIYDEKTAVRMEKETDVRMLIPYLASPPHLDDMVFAKGNRMCPTTEASLLLYSYKKRKVLEGHEKAFGILESNIDMIRHYSRGGVFVPEPTG